MIAVVALVALGASLLTFYSGFGLGTLLSAVLMIFFDIETSILITAIVHLLNNLFKFFLVGKNLDKSVVLKFGIPSILGALIGAFILKFINPTPIVEYNFLNKTNTVTITKIIIGLLMILFSLIELFSYSKKFEASNNQLTIGGLISGFFGGLSGHQGALRSMFLIKANLSKEAFIATGTAIACLVDFTRIPIYFSTESISIINNNKSLIITATLFAFIGAYVGSKLIPKITIDIIQKIVGLLIIFISILLIIGYL